MVAGGVLRIVVWAIQTSTSSADKMKAELYTAQRKFRPTCTNRSMRCSAAALILTNGPSTFPHLPEPTVETQNTDIGWPLRPSSLFHSLFFFFLFCSVICHWYNKALLADPEKFGILPFLFAAGQFCGNRVMLFRRVAALSSFFFCDNAEEEDVSTVWKGAAERESRQPNKAKVSEIFQVCRNVVELFTTFFFFFFSLYTGCHPLVFILFIFFCFIRYSVAGCDARPTVPPSSSSPLFFSRFIPPDSQTKFDCVQQEGWNYGLVPPSISPPITPWIIWHKSGHNLLIFFLSFYLISIYFFLCVNTVFGALDSTSSLYFFL